MTNDKPLAAQRQGIQSVEVAMKALEAIERIGGPATLSAIATEAAMSPSSAHRYLVSLSRVGLVAQDSATGTYDLGPAARRLGLEAIRRQDDVNMATGHAATLRNRTGHAVNIAVWGDSGPIIVRWEYGRFPLPIFARVGSTLPLIDSSAGRVFLAYMPESVTQSALRLQQQHGECSRPEPDEVRRILDEVRKEGIATTTGAILPGLIVLAAPVFGPSDTLALVFSATIPARMSSPAVIRAVGKELRGCTARLTSELGGTALAVVDP